MRERVGAEGDREREKRVEGERVRERMGESKGEMERG